MAMVVSQRCTLARSVDKQLTTTSDTETDNSELTCCQMRGQTPDHQPTTQTNNQITGLRTRLHSSGLLVSNSLWPTVWTNT